MDHDWGHCSASWGGSLLLVVAGRVGEAGAWTEHEVLVDTDQARADVAGAQEVVVHLVAAVEVALSVGGPARARIQTLAA